MKHPQHIVCIPSSSVQATPEGLSEYTLSSADIMLGQRERLETDERFRQVLPVAVLTHKGKVWAYRRTSSSGESRLHGKVALAVGGHWDAEDLVWKDSVLDVHESMMVALRRELEEEVEMAPVSIAEELPLAICANDTLVDRVHLALVTRFELEKPFAESREDALDELGFVEPGELLSGEYELETWSRLILEQLKK